MAKILIVSDDGVASGYGRISQEINTRLVKRGYQVSAASILYDGLLPPSYEGVQLPYWVSALGGKANWVECVVNLISVYQPDIVSVIQDAPYGEAIYNAPIDWSKHAFMMTTPVDGTPIRSAWVDIMRKADAALTISQFGVDAYADAGVESKLLRPGVDGNTFYPLPAAKRLELRAKLGIEPDAFVFGMAAQNQGRKAIPDTVHVFYRFAKDKPTARLLLDMDAVSPAGWDILDLCKHYHYDPKRIIFRADAARAGLTHMRERFALMDVHSVLAHREGWGLPLVEAMACGVPSMALDWCSGTEICGNGNGILVNPIPYSTNSSWGNALDKFPDLDHAVQQLQHLYDHPAERQAIAERGMNTARAYTWDAATDVMQAAIDRVMAKRTAKAQQTPPQTVVSLTGQAQPSPDGIVRDVQLMEMG